VAVDGSANAERASRFAVELADNLNAELIVLHVVPRVSHAFVAVRSTLLFREYYFEERKAALEWMEKIVARAKSRGVAVKPEIRLAPPSVAQEIIDYATAKDVDLIVMGTRGIGSFKKLLLGSVSSAVVAHARCSVLVMR
jgi:nucleotide-binding universal stress UspA family protein